MLSSPRPRSQGRWVRQDERRWELGCLDSDPQVPPMTMSLHSREVSVDGDSTV